MFAYYSFIVSLLVSAAVVWKRLLLLTGRGLREDLDERLGRVVLPRMKPGKGVVINAVSVGEVAEAETLIRALREEVPDIQVVITTGNIDGRNRAKQISGRLGMEIGVVYLPWDRKSALINWLQKLCPVSVITLESEIWPNLFLACRDLKIPVFVANGRIYRRDIKRYKLARRFFAHVLSCAEWIGVQNEKERESFRHIGADTSKVEVVGNLKMSPAHVVSAQTDARLGHLQTISAPIITAGSTHPPEEEWILDSFVDLRPHNKTLKLVIAPRHVHRARSIERLCRSRALLPASWSDVESVRQPWDVLVIDEVGWLPTIYSFSQIAVIGGTFADRGGHNPAEAAEHGCAVVVGPSIFNFEEIVNEFDLAGGIVRTGGNQLMTTLETLLSDARARTRIGSIARTLLRHHSDCSSRYSSAILSRMRTLSEYSIDSQRAIKTTDHSWQRSNGESCFAGEPEKQEVASVQKGKLFP